MSHFTYYMGLDVDRRSQPPSNGAYQHKHRAGDGGASLSGRRAAVSTLAEFSSSYGSSFPDCSLRGWKLSYIKVFVAVKLQF